MNLTVKPSELLKGTVKLPASKSYSIRAHMVAACGGKSKIKNPSNCEDAVVAARVARYLKSRKPAASKINVGESGTVLRLLLPLLALRGRPIMVVGEGTLKGRPNKHLTQSLRNMGVRIKGQGKNESTPIVLQDSIMKGGRVCIDGSLSSQFVSALLIACPQLQEDTQLILTGKKIVSTDYILMTDQILRLSGVRIKRKGLRKYEVKGNQKFKGLGSFEVPSDFGLAAFHMGAALLNESNVTLKGCLTKKFIQADGHIIPLLRKMGARFRMDAKTIRIQGPCPLKGGRFSLKNCPDLVPIMSVLALFAKGKTTFTDIAHVRTKESDRISDLRKELIKVGAKVQESRDSLTVIPQRTYKANRTLDPHHDHRLAMAFSVLGTKIGVRVKNIECSHKSYPDFVKDFKAIGAKAVKKR